MQAIKAEAEDLEKGQEGTTTGSEKGVDASLKAGGERDVEIQALQV
jgi:hypothetical protein